MQTEVAEVSEPVAEGRGGSSTMPHKRNPIACSAILTAAQRTPDWWRRFTPARFSSMNAPWRLAGGMGDPARADYAGGGALAQSDALVREMQVFPQKMRADLEITTD